MADLRPPEEQATPVAIEKAAPPETIVPEQSPPNPVLGENGEEKTIPSSSPTADAAATTTTTTIVPDEANGVKEQSLPVYKSPLEHMEFIE